MRKPTGSKHKKDTEGLVSFNGWLRDVNLLTEVSGTLCCGCILSTAVYDDESMENKSENSWNETYAQLYGRDLKGKDRLTKCWYDNSIFKIVDSKTTEELKKVRYWINCDGDDFLNNVNCEPHIWLTDKKVPHEFRLRDGEHNWDYWPTGITVVLQFIDNSFHQ